MASPLLKSFIATEADRSFPSSMGDGRLPIGSMAHPELFEATAETFNATSTTFRFDRGATIVNQKRRYTILTDNLTAHVIRCPERSGIIEVGWRQDGTGSRTIPTPTAVKADGTTAVAIKFAGAAFPTESTTAYYEDVIVFAYDEANAVLREISRVVGLDYTP